MDIVARSREAVLRRQAVPFQHTIVQQADEIARLTAALNHQRDVAALMLRDAERATRDKPTHCPHCGANLAARYKGDVEA